MIVYKITNLINNKIYIGQTTISLSKRWSRHCDRNTGSVISSAIQKYGKDNFEIKVIAKANTIEELNHRETYYIKLYNSISPNGYNLMSGGNNSRHTDETKRNLSVKLSGFGKDRHLAIETKNKIAEFNRGQRRPDAVKVSMSLTKGGKPFVAKNSDGSIAWQGLLISECAKELKLHGSCIRLCLYGRQKAHNGYIFQYELVNGTK